MSEDFRKYKGIEVFNLLFGKLVIFRESKKLEGGWNETPKV